MSKLIGPDLDPPAAVRRPGMIWALSILVIVLATLGALGAMLLLSAVSDAESHGQSTSGAARVIAVILLVCALVQADGAVLLFLGRNLGRFLVMGVGGLVILINLIGLLSGAGVQGCVTIVVNGAMIAAMMRQDVKDWCRR